MLNYLAARPKTGVPKKSPSRDKLVVFVVTLLLLIVPFAIYYMFYVKNQRTYFTNRNLRALALLSNQVGTKVQNLKDVLQNAGDRFLTPPQPAQRQVKGSGKLGSDQSKKKGGTVPAYDYAAIDASNRDKMAEFLKSLQETGQPLVVVEFINPRHAKIDGNPNLKSWVTIEVRSESDSQWLYLDYVYQADNQSTIKIGTKAELRTLVLPMLSQGHVESYGNGEQEDEFGNILIAGSGPEFNIIFQKDISEFHVISLDKLIADDGGKLDISGFDRASQVVDITVAGSSHKLFLHPISLPFGKNGNKDDAALRWIIGGLVPAARFQQATWSISYSVLIIFVSILALTSLSWPFLKLILMGPKERLRTADIYFLFFSVLMAVSLLTILGMYFYSYDNLERQMDLQLKTLREDILTNFTSELRASLAELKTLNDAGGKDFASLSSKAGSKEEIAKGREETMNLLPAVQNYPYFGAAVWIDPNGRQRIKWTQSDYVSQLISVESRDYFRNLKAGRYLSLDNNNFWLEPILSRTTGRTEVEISAPIGKTGWISALDTRMISLMEPVLPTGFGYCIVDTSGTVLFHSDESGHLGENFFRECDNDANVVSAVLDRKETELSVRYLGKGHRLVTGPVKSIPNWSLIVFRDKQPLRTVFLEILTLTTLLFLIYSLLLLLAMSAFYLLNIKTNERRAWVWPTRERTLDYYFSILVLLGLSAISLVLILLSHGWAVIVICYVTSFVGIILYFFNLKFRLFQRNATFIKRTRVWRNSYRLRQRLNHHDLTYTLNLALLLLLTAGLPSLAFFRFAYESQVKLMVQYGQLNISDGLAARDERIRNLYANRSNPPSRTNEFVQDRFKVSGDIYSEFFFGTTVSGPDGDHAIDHPSEPSQWLLSRLSGVIPPFNRYSTLKQGLLENKFADSSRVWHADSGSPQVLQLHADAGSANEKRSYHIYSGIPEFPRFNRWVGVSFLGLCLVIYFWLYLIIRKVFLLDFHKPTSTALKYLLPNEKGTNLFVILDGPFTQQNDIDTDRYYLLDLQQVATAENWPDSVPYVTLPDNKGVAVYHFDYKYTDPQANREKIWFLERLQNKTVIVFSRTHPDLYRLTVLDQDGSDESDRWLASEFGDRWSGLMSKFRKVYIEDEGNRSDFDVEVRTKSQEAQSREKKSRLKKRVAGTYELLIKECASKLPLQQLARAIMEQPGFSRLTRDHLINRIAKQAHTYYDKIWETCSDGEKLTLFNLAQDRLLSPQNYHIESLMRRGLIVRNPDLHLMNESFRRFVKLEKASEILSHHQNEWGSRWRILKLPLLLALISIVVFLFITQRDTYNSTLAILAATATIIPTFFKILSLLQEDPLAQLSHESAPGRGNR